MNSAEHHYQSLLDKLDGFIRKYYLNQLLRGALLTVALLIGFYLCVTLLESFVWFGQGIRSVLFMAYLASTVFVLWTFIVLPLRGLYRLGKTLSHEEAARLIGLHFPEIADKLLNTLQLHQQSQQNLSD